MVFEVVVSEETNSPPICKPQETYDLAKPMVFEGSPCRRKLSQPPCENLRKPYETLGHIWFFEGF